MRRVCQVPVHDGNHNANIPDDVKVIALVIHNPARPAPFDSVDIENSVVTKTETAPRASKFKSNHRLVIQNDHHIYKGPQNAKCLPSTPRHTLVVLSILACRLLRKRLSAEKARTVTIPSNSSPKSEKIGERELDSILRRSRPVLR